MLYSGLDKRNIIVDTNKTIANQDKALILLMKEHKKNNPGHIINKYNNYIHCTCRYHVHAINDNLVEHNSDYSKFRLNALAGIR